MREIFHETEMKLPSKSFCFALAALIMAFLAVEAVMTVFDPYLFKSIYLYDRELGFRIKPHLAGDGLQSNAFGFNDDDYPLEKPEGVFRILVVGDSFNWCGGKDGNYCALLERKFSSRAGGRRVEVINAGYFMTHTAEQLALLKKFGLGYNPDLVVLGFFAGNDFKDAFPYLKRIAVNGLYTDIDTRCPLIEVGGRPVIFQSRLLLLLRQRSALLCEIIKKRLSGKEGFFSERAFLDIEKTRLDICNLNNHRMGMYRERIGYALKSVSEMDELLRQRGIKFIVAIYPDEFQVSERLKERLFKKFNLKSGDFRMDMPQMVLKEHLRSRGIPHLDMLDAFRREGEKRDLYLPFDTHWNEAGNALAADLLFDYLVGAAGSGP